MKFRWIFTIIMVVGLLATTGFTPAMAQNDTTDCGSTYVVQGGDYLTKIANECGVSYTDLIQANPNIDNPNLIFPGQVINIPSGSGNVSIPVTGGSIYIVQPGDTLQQIANRFNVSLADLRSANPGLVNDTIYTGMRLTLPQGAARVPTVTISPLQAQPGTTVTLAATGFRANTPVLIGFGQLNTVFYQTAEATTDANGAVYRQIQIPSWATQGANNYAFVVQSKDDPGVRAISDLISVYTPSQGNSGGIPVTGQGYYVVQSGDTIDGIATMFNISVQALLNANPQINDPNLIYTGQRIYLPAGAQATNPYVVPSAFQASPGQEIIVRAYNFPDNAIVDVRMAQVGESYSAVWDAQMDEQGNLTKTITIPSTANPGEQWQVIVTTTDRANGTSAVSQPITIVQ